MKATLVILALTMLACHSQTKEENLDVSKGIRVKRGSDGKVIAVPDSSRMDSL